MRVLALGFRAIGGGAVVVGVTSVDALPQIVLSTVIELDEQPYHAAGELMRGGGTLAQAQALVAAARKRQDKLAAAAVRELVREHHPGVAALLVNRAGWVKDLLGYSLAFDEHAVVAEGLAIREALRFAIGRAGVKLVEIDEKTLGAKVEIAAPPKPWRKEHKLACAAAWTALG